MDARQFDGFVRRLTIGASRRRVLGLLLAGGLGGTQSLLQRREAEARCRPRNRKCGTICCEQGTFCRDPLTELCVSLSGSCEAEENFCSSGDDPARCGAVGSDCLCLRTFDKKTRCGLAFGNCGDCTRDKECTAVFGPGSFCAKDIEGSGFCRSCTKAIGLGFCAQPCLTS
jgi:hypothetical protein